MANMIENLRKRIASGEVTPDQGGSTGVKVPEGTFLVKVEESSFGKGQSGNNLRGMIKFHVLGCVDHPGSGVGGSFNLYLPITPEKMVEGQVAFWTQTLVDMGVSEDRIFQDAEDMCDVLTNICTLLHKLGMKDKAYFVVDRKIQAKTKDLKNPYYNNIVLEIIKPEDLEARLKACEPKPSKFDDSDDVSVKVTPKSKKINFDDEI